MARKPGKKIDTIVVEKYGQKIILEVRMVKPDRDYGKTEFIVCNDDHNISVTDEVLDKASKQAVKEAEAGLSVDIRRKVFVKFQQVDDGTGWGTVKAEGFYFGFRVVEYAFRPDGSFHGWRKVGDDGQGHGGWSGHALKEMRDDDEETRRRPKHFGPRDEATILYDYSEDLVDRLTRFKQAVKALKDKIYSVMHPDEFMEVLMGPGLPQLAAAEPSDEE